jgi:flagellar hook-basal body complex protein FliE
MNPISGLRPLPTSELPAARIQEAAQRLQQAATANRPAALHELEATRSPWNLPALPSAPPGPSFEAVLKNFVGEVNAKQAAAGQTVQGLLRGDPVSLHQAMIAMEEASVSFQLMVEVRNRLLESYQELMRMQI